MNYHLEDFKKEVDVLIFIAYSFLIVFGIIITAWPNGYIGKLGIPAEVFISCILIALIWFATTFTIRTILRYLQLKLKRTSLRAHKTYVRVWLGTLIVVDTVALVACVYLSPLLPKELPPHAIEIAHKIFGL